MQTLGIIPARFASTRFPGKPLVMINGMTMIQRVYKQACLAKTLDNVMVATDDDRIFKHVMGFGGKVIMTSADHPSGTDRCGEVLAKLEKEDGAKTGIVVNIQGDEPFLRPEQIDQLTACFKDPNVQIATLAKVIDDDKILQNPNSVKVVTDVNGFALLFSRSAIPYLRNSKQGRLTGQHIFLRHLGIYAYRADILKQITSLKPGVLELAEALEQLRWLENGFKIKVEQTEFESISIDTPGDVEQLNVTRDA